ncbi:MAG: hypothetical protein KF726_09930 [Anaerolineae bacterium]|nr:hypothetical protein [Anaerolineae bacterium]
MRRWLILLGICIIFTGLSFTNHASIVVAQPDERLSITELKYKVIDYFGGISGNGWYKNGIGFCDPYIYPVGMAGRVENDALKYFGSIQQDSDTFQTIIRRLGLGNTPTFDKETKLEIYQQCRYLQRVPLNLQGDIHSFSNLMIRQAGKDYVAAGTVDWDGDVSVTDSKPADFSYQCPTCLTRSTQIDTPTGPKSVEFIQIGDEVWSAYSNGEKFVAKVIHIFRTPVEDHRVVRIGVNNGVFLEVSGGHPLPNGQTVQSLTLNTSLISSSPSPFGASVTSLETVAYDGNLTYDILPEGETGFYFANGILLASTLKFSCD